MCQRNKAAKTAKPSEYVSAEEFADHFGLSVESVLRRVRAGQIQGIVMGDRCRIRRAVLDRFASALPGELARYSHILTGAVVLAVLVRLDYKLALFYQIVQALRA